MLPFCVAMSAVAHHYHNHIQSASIQEYSGSRKKAARCIHCGCKVQHSVYFNTAVINFDKSGRLKKGIS